MDHHAHHHHTDPPAPTPPASPGAATEWTCPMHPEIIRDKPGNCPICGMALEPRTVTSAEEPENPELREMTRRFWVSVVLSVPLLLIAMAPHLGWSLFEGIAAPRRDAEAIEVLRKVDTLVVDKTGTLTEGKPRLVSVQPAPGVEEGDLLRLAAALERGSEHPLAAARRKSGSPWERVRTWRWKAQV